MVDFKGTTLAVGDNVVFTDSFNRLLEGRVIGFMGNLIQVSPIINNLMGNPKTVHYKAILKMS
jgi:hypothetical protein